MPACGSRPPSRRAHAAIPHAPQQPLDIERFRRGHAVGVRQKLVSNFGPNGPDQPRLASGGRNICSSRYVVVVLPSVPVTAKRAISPLGWPRIPRREAERAPGIGYVHGRSARRGYALLGDDGRSAVAHRLVHKERAAAPDVSTHGWHCHKESARSHGPRVVRDVENLDVLHPGRQLRGKGMEQS